VRDITAADLSTSEDDLDAPTFQRIRRKQAANESMGSIYKGYKGMIIDNNDLDVPTFLRRKAD
jgi:cell division protein FtsZ